MHAEVGGIKVTLEAAQVAAGLVVARGCRTEVAPSGLVAALDEVIAGSSDPAHLEDRKGVVRDLLRFGKYKPTGRGKPASEYLLKAAQEGRFPRINNLVDINNLVSLRYLLPISLVDLVRAETAEFSIRRGRSGESYVFNAAGQVIDLEDLLLVARLPADAPCANPVKDSMETKLNEDSKDVMAVLYAPVSLRGVLVEATEEFGKALGAWGGASSVATASVVS